MNKVSETKFDTNNAWGFGGGIGTETVYDNGLVNRKGKAYFRHTPSQSYDNWYVQTDEDWHELNKKPKPGDIIFKVTRAGTGSDLYIIAKTPEEAMEIALKSSQWFLPIAAEQFLIVK